MHSPPPDPTVRTTVRTSVLTLAGVDGCIRAGDDRLKALLTTSPTVQGCGYLACIAAGIWVAIADWSQRGGNSEFSAAVALLLLAVLGPMTLAALARIGRQLRARQLRGRGGLPAAAVPSTTTHADRAGAHADRAGPDQPGP